VSISSAQSRFLRRWPNNAGMPIESRRFPLLSEFPNSAGVPVSSTLTKYSCTYACNKGIWRSGSIPPLILHVGTTRKWAVSLKPQPQYYDRLDTVCLCSFPTFLVFPIAPGRLLPNLSSTFLKYLLLLFLTFSLCSVFTTFLTLRESPYCVLSFLYVSCITPHFTSSQWTIMSSCCSTEKDGSAV